MFLPCSFSIRSRSIFLLQCRALHLSSTRLGQGYYDDLGVHPQSSSKEIKDAFYKLSKEYHPDRNVDDPTALTKFQNISEAYDTLSNPAQRTKYDKGVLGRSSSVAEREASAHRFEGEAFYESRSSKIHRNSDTSRNLDSWVKDQRKLSFESKLRKVKVDGQNNMKGKSMFDKRLASSSSNQNTDQGIGFLLLVIVFLVVFIRCVL
eukprot:GFUD01007001.1.p1 GENE.GFUD01007001.1~~GFUD01007001.1.p1  ORF type:complete len:206 (-),score=29.45 GFUD01007001.1:46-663(-)